MTFVTHLSCSVWLSTVCVCVMCVTKNTHEGGGGGGYSGVNFGHPECEVFQKTLSEVSEMGGRGYSK